MNYDYDYYSGKDLHYPVKPTKPKLDRDHTPAAARSYADDLEQYEKDLGNYNIDRLYVKNEQALRLKKFQDVLRDDYDITEAQFSVLWRKAWEDGHSEGLHRVVAIFDELYEIASQFAALEG